MSRRGFGSLKKKAITAISLILIAGLSINTVVLTAVATGKYKSAILSKSSAIGENLQRELGKVLGLGVPLDGLEGADEKLQEVTMRNPAIGYAMIIDPNGRVIYHSEKSQRSKQLNDGTTQRAAAAEETLVQSAGAVYDIALPLRNAENGLAGALRIGVKAQAINAQVYVLLLWAVGIVVVCFLLSMALVSAFVMRVVLRPINEMKEAAERMAGGDLTSAVEVKGDDEIAALQRSINRIGMNLKDMIGKVTRITNSVAGVTTHVVSSAQGVLDVADTQKKVVDETAEAISAVDGSLAQVSSNVEHLSEAAANTSSSIYEMSASIGKIAENAGIFSETANETASSVEEMVSTIKQIARSLENLSTSSEAIASSIDEVNATTRHIEERANESVDLTGKVMENASVKGSGAAGLAVRGMEEIKSTVAALSEMINGLGRKTGDIGKIINVIDDVADQTNLLAINAAILASKAGEHGKGFTVVADEIKSLAERTSFSTSEVAALIKSVQDMTRSSMTMAGDAIHTVEKGLSLVRDVGSALSEIVESAKVSSEMAKAIQRATAEEALAVKQITDAVEGMTVQTETISRAIQEQSKGSRFIVDATERVKNLSHQVRIATSEQKDGSRQMSGIVEQMTSQTMQIADAVSRQKEKSRELVGSVERIRSSAGKLIAAANAMNSVIGSLKTESENLTSELKQFRT